MSFGGGGGNTTTVQKADPWEGLQPFLIGTPGTPEERDEAGNVIKPAEPGTPGIWNIAQDLFNQGVAKGEYPGSTYIAPNAWEQGALASLGTTQGLLGETGMGLVGAGGLGIHRANTALEGLDRTVSAADLMPTYNGVQFASTPYSGPEAKSQITAYSGPSGAFTPTAYGGPSGDYTAGAYGGPTPTYSARGYTGPEATYNASAYTGAGDAGVYTPREYAERGYTPGSFTEWELDPTQDENFMNALDASYNPLIERFTRELLPQISSAAEMQGAYSGSAGYMPGVIAAQDLTQNLADATARAVQDQARFARSGLATQENMLEQLASERFTTLEGQRTSRFNTQEQLIQEMARQAEALATQRWGVGEELGARASATNAELASQRYTAEEQLRGAADIAAGQQATARYGVAEQVNQAAKEAAAQLASQRWGIGNQLAQQAAETEAQLASSRWATGAQIASAEAQREAELATSRWGTTEQLASQRWGIGEQLGTQRWQDLFKGELGLQSMREGQVADIDKAMLAVAPALSQLGLGAVGQTPALASAAGGMVRGWENQALAAAMQDWYGPQQYEQGLLNNYANILTGLNPGGGTSSSTAPGPSTASSVLGGAAAGGLGAYALSAALPETLGFLGGPWGLAGGAILGGLMGAF